MKTYRLLLQSLPDDEPPPPEEWIPSVLLMLNVGIYVWWEGRIDFFYVMGSIGSWLC